jgi:hypothetical protein
MLIPNKKLLRLVQKQIHYFPRNWEQGIYGRRGGGWARRLAGVDYSNPCGTAACVAGHAMLASGYSLVGNTFYEDGLEVDPHEAGRKALGLTPQQAGALFDGMNSLARVDKIIDCLCDEADRLEAQQACEKVPA